MKKGSITVYLSLVLCVIVSLIFTAMDSARLSCGRAMLSLAADEGLFSLFGEYDRVLYEKYGLLFIDGGYNSGTLKAGELLKKTTETTEKALSSGILPAGGLPSNLFRIEIEQKAITGCVLATDSGGEALKTQIRELMRAKIGMDLLGGAVEQFSEAALIAESAEEGKDEMMNRLREEYETQSREAQERKRQEEAEKASEETPAPEEAPPAEPVRNPIDTVYRLKKLGIFAWAVPDPARISTGRIDKRALPSSRTLRTGMGVMPKESSSPEDRFLLSKYIVDYFPAFTDETEGDFRYQAEYAVAGKAGDADNLKSVLKRLLLIRETLNSVYLMTDAEKKAEADALGLLIAAALFIPEAAELVSAILILCWAFGESMMDIKVLLAGGRIPLLKDPLTWQLPLEDLASLSIHTTPADRQKGFDYKEYLCILLMMKSSSKLVAGITDLLEYNRRQSEGGSGFAIDTCICSMEIQLDGRIGGHPAALVRSFGYDKM